MLYKVLYEKEKKIREGMKMMGMSNFSFYMSWYISYSINYTFVAIVMCLIIKRLIFTNCDLGLLIVMFLLFTQVLIFFAFFISVFFTTAKSGLIFGLSLYIFMYYIRLFIGDSIDTGTLYAISLSPLSDMYLFLKTILFLQGSDLPFTSAQLNLVV